MSTRGQASRRARAKRAARWKLLIGLTPLIPVEAFIFWAFARHAVTACIYGGSAMACWGYIQWHLHRASMQRASRL